MAPLKPPADWSDEDLVRECLDGSELAWASLIDKYKNLVYSVPLKYQLPPEDCADVFQFVWTELFRGMGRIDRVGGLRKWLMTTAARNSLLHKKRLRSTTMLAVDPELPDQTPNAAQMHIEVEREQMVREAITGLPPRCQELVRKLFFAHPPKPYSEVARELGLAEGSIGFIRGRCLKKLKSRLDELGYRVNLRSR